MIVNPGIRRFLGSAIQRLFNSASFYAPLTHSLVLERGTGSPSFTRASTATVMGYGPTANPGDDAILLTVAANEARFEGARRISEGVWSNTFADGSLIPAATNTGYLAEGARTNLCLQSQTLGTTWAGDASTSVTADQYVAPDGTTTMDKVTSLAGTSQHYLKQGITFSAGVTTYSFYLRYVNNQWCALVMSNGGGLLAASFDLLNGVVGALGAGTTSTIQATAIADVYRVSITGTMSAGAGYLFISPNATDSASLQNYTAAGTETIGAWGAQLELGSFASSYIPTTTAAVTRDADVLTYSGGDVPNLKTLCATFKRESGVASAGWAVALSDGTTSNYESISAASATEARFLGVTGGVTQWDVIPSYTAGTTSKAAFSAATNDIKMAKDGVAQTQDTSATVPTVTQLNVGHVAGSFQFSGNVGGIYGWTRNLSQSELNAVTS